MGSERNYGKGTERALFMLSRGTCYEPTCDVRVLKMTKSGRPQSGVQIAHIHALADGEARFDGNVPKPERNRFWNLILLCQAHHIDVDADGWEIEYPADVLFGWKAAVETADLKTALEAVPPLSTDQALQEMLVDAVDAVRDEIIDAIDELRGISAGTAKMVKTLVLESFNRPYLSKEQIDSLENSARVFSAIEGQTLMLHDSAKIIENTAEYGVLLASSVEPIKTVPDFLPALVNFADAIRLLPDYTRPFSEAAQVLGGSRDSIIHLHDATTAVINSNMIDGLASQVQLLSDQIGRAEAAAERFGGTIGGLDRIKDTAASMTATADSLTATARAFTTVDHAPVTTRLDQLERRNLFWTGFGVAIGVVIALGILFAVLF